MSYEELQKRAKAYALSQGWTEEQYKNEESPFPARPVTVIEDENEWPGTCICDDPEPEHPDHGHHNEAGGYCCPHHGNTCGHCYQYG